MITIIAIKSPGACNLLSQYKLLNTAALSNYMKCAFCGEEDEQKLLLSTRVVGEKVEHTQMCFGCWWAERFEWKKKFKNGTRTQKEDRRKQNTERIRPMPTKPCDL